MHGAFEAIDMNTAINISSGTKLLDNPANPVVIMIAAGNPPEHCTAPEHLPHCTVETIRERAETVTPLLKEMLDYWPSEHWGLNE